MKLLVVESPTKSRTLQKFLDPKTYRVLSSFGHIRDLPKSKFGVDVEKNFKPHYVIPPKARKYIKPLKEVCQRAETIILGTDEDREGEAIAWHLAQALGLSEIKNQKGAYGESATAKIKNYQRIVFHEITKKAIIEALKRPRDIDMNLVNAQQARRILDRIVGYKLSPFLWKKVLRGLSAGRVQSVAVRLIVEREREIEKFIAQEYWKITAFLQKSKNQLSQLIEARPLSMEFEAVLDKKNGKTIPKMGIKTKKEAEKIVKDLKGAEYKVSRVEKKEVKRNPLPPFTTSTLQQEAWKRFRWPAKFTMRVAQNLYERGLISYHRTDSLNLSDLSLFSAKKFIIEDYGENYWAGFLRKYKTKAKGAQEAHEAIRPTYPAKTPEKLKIQAKLDEQGCRLYELIWRRFIACQMSQALFDSTTVDIAAKNYIFKATGQILKFDGFLKVYPLKYEETELPLLEKNEILELIKLLPSQHFTQPPPRYTEATLIKALEQNEIGRPSTYAPILSIIQERNYVQKDEKKSLQPTETGIIVNGLLVEHFPRIVDIKFTAKMEEELDEIAQGQKEWTNVLEKFYGPFAKNLAKKYEVVEKKDVVPQEKTNKTCHKCGAPLIIKLSRYGKFYSCAKFPECKYKEPLPPKKLGIKCPKCQLIAKQLQEAARPVRKGEIIEKKTKKGKIFYACNQYPDCDFALWDKPTGNICPECGSLLVQTKRKQIKCSNKECNFIKQDGQ